MADEMILTSEERVMILRHRQDTRDAVAFNSGVRAAHAHLLSLADQCCGGSGEGEAASSYRAAAQSLTSVLKPVR
jgi:hypothetical protein